MRLSLLTGRLVGLLAATALLAVPGCRATGATAQSPPGGARMSEAEVAGLLLLSGNQEIAYSRVAAARTYDSAVLAYAARVRTDHASMNASLMEIIAVAGLDAAEGVRGGVLRETSAERRAMLETLSGRALDVGYLDVALQSQRELLALLDLIQPSVTRGALGDHVMALRPVVAAHVAHAEQLRGTLTARE